MTTKELIQTELDHLSGEELEELFAVIRRYLQSKHQSPKPGLMSQLRSISIDAPEDFATQHDRYVTGEKRADQNLQSLMISFASNR
jgi:hypothetical protein